MKYGNLCFQLEPLHIVSRCLIRNKIIAMSLMFPKFEALFQSFGNMIDNTTCGGLKHVLRVATMTVMTPNPD